VPHPKEPTTERTWLSLGPASRLVGVDPDTLRRWADEGRVEVYLTPGGHRRFGRRSLERLVRTHPRERVRISRLGAPEQKLVAAYRRTYRAGHELEPDLLQAVPDSDREAFRHNGRELVAALVEHLDHDGATRRAALETARKTAAMLGADLARSGASLTDAVVLFVAARRPFMTELGALARRRALDSRQVALLFDHASAALDQCLLSFVEGHQSWGRPPRG
jgi:hypothetical protein